MSVYLPIDSSFYKRNRRLLSDKLNNDSILVSTANKSFIRSGDGSYNFIQNSNFYYLTGIDVEDVVLVILKIKNRSEEFLFIKKPNEKNTLWDGPLLTKEQVSLLSGIENIKYLEELSGFYKSAINGIETLYFHDDLQHKKGSISWEKHFNTQLKKIFNRKIQVNFSEMLIPFRLIKTDAEIHQIKKAISLSINGFKKMAQIVEPGITEFELAAKLFYEMKTKRHAFQPIVASGQNACILHYIKNDDVVKKGETVLFDFGAEYGNYKADISRVLPVNGVFNNRQIEVYEAVHEAFNAIKSEMKPGNSLKEIRAFSKDYLGKQIKKLGLIDEINLEKTNKYYPHGPSHYLGLDVHDVGLSDQELTPGMVVTCEPGIYINAEKLGIRLENDILITKNGNEDLCSDLPLSIKEIENLKS